jgi:uncharacterized Zn-binding protein involved in type VI secretion
MADVVNQGKKVASTSSGLDATTGGAKDVNFNPPKTVSSPHVNKAPLADATEHASKTEMAGGKTIREGDKIGPPSKDPHADTGGGVQSGTYIQEAKDTSGSPNVKAEGKPVARDKDNTTQNHANTTGQVLDPAAAAELARAQEEAKKACSMDLIKVEKAIPFGDGTRNIEQSRLLEIVDRNPTNLEAKRKNAKKPGDPECQASPNHTKWIVSRKKGGGMEPLQRELFGDVQVLEEAWYNPGLDFSPDLKSSARTDGEARDRLADRRARQAGDQAARDNAGDQISRRSREMRGLDPNTTDNRVVGERTPLTGDRGGARQAARDEWDNGGRDRYAQQQADRTRTLERAQSLSKWLEIYKFRSDPRKINVQALACSGSQNFELIIFPFPEQEFACGPAEFEIIGAAFQRIQSFIDWGQRLINLVGGRVSIQFVWLQEPEVKLNVQWKELTRDVPAIGLTKYQCNKAVDFTVSIKRLLGCEVRVGVPLSALLNAIPGLGWVAQKIIDYIADAQVGIRFKLDLSVGVKAGWNEYEEWQSANLQISFPFRRLGSVTVEAGVKGEPTFNNLKKYPPENDIGFDLAEGKIEPGVKAMFRIRALWWERDESGEWFPESWKFRYGAQTFRPLRSLFARNNG